jgi:hypothetical protein
MLLGSHRRILLAALAALCLLLALAAPPADARKSIKKSIWGPVQVRGVSQFPIYRDLGAGVYQMALNWSTAAPTRPARPTDPADPAYRWPAEVDYAVSEARRHGIRVALLVQGTPPWANGGRSRRWAPRDPGDYARFLTAVAQRYPGVRLWLIWGEPTRGDNFKPLFHERRDRALTRRMRQGPHTYARLLDAAYGALKQSNRRNLVIGGNSFVTGDVSPRNWIKNLRLPNGRAPRMDMYGHNPFSARRPNLRRRPLGHGFADFSDLDTLAGWVDRYLRRPNGRRMKLFLSEFFIPTDHFNHEFNFYVSRRTAASWLKSSLRITRRWSRIYTLGWFSLYDDPPHLSARGKRDEVNRGLLTSGGRRKPAYNVFKRG